MENKIKNKFLKRKKPLNEKLFIFFCMLYPLTHLFIFGILPNVMTIFMAFQRPYILENKMVFDFGYNFKLFFQNFASPRSDMPRFILNSVLYFPVIAFGMLPLSVIAAYFCYRKIKFSNIFRFIFFLPNVIPVVIMGFVYRAMWDNNFGPINRLLIDAFNMPVESVPAWLLDPKYAMGMLYIYCIWAGIGFNVVVLNGAMTRVPAEIFESARIDGVKIPREIVQIVVPLVWPTLTILLVSALMAVFLQSVHPLIITPGQIGKTTTIGLLILNAVMEGKVYYAAAMGILFSVIAIPLVQLFRRFLERLIDTTEV